jgi:predicted transcriptional regulator
MLQQLLEKLGITDFAALSSEERKTYEEWAKVLTVADVSMDDVRKFVALEGARATDELMKLDNSKEREIFYKVLCHLTAVLKSFIDVPSAQRDALRSHLKQTFKVDI